MSAPRIPTPVIGVAADVLAAVFTHATMDTAFLAAGAPGDIPGGSKVAKAREWLTRTNRSTTSKPLGVLGALLAEVFHVDLPNDFSEAWNAPRMEQRARLNVVLERCGLRYEPVGKVVPLAVTPAARTLAEILAERDWESVHSEFERAVGNVDSSPADAVSAACNLLESLLKTYLQDEGHAVPSKKDIAGLWGNARTRLGLDPTAMADNDLKQILGGLETVTSGIGALRTHASTAHGQGRNPYRLAPRHARLAVNAAHTMATFIIETWDARRAAASK